MPKTENREYSLDVLKIFATIIIVFHHYQQITGAKFQYINFFDGAFYFGYVVELFFILSGMFMYRYISKIENEDMTFSEFMKRRYFRLIPLVAVSAVVYEILITVYPLICSGLWAGSIEPTIWGTLLDCLGIQAGWASINPCVNNPTWYVSVLVLCYIIFYFISYISKHASGGVKSEYCYVVMILIGMGIMAYSINLPFLNEYSSRGYVSFFFGVLLGKYMNTRKISKKMWCGSLFAFLLMILITVNCPELVGSHVLTFIVYPALIIVFKYPSVEKLFHYSWIGTMGKISFNVYIWHNCMFPLMYLLKAYFDWHIHLQSMTTMLMFAILAFFFGTLSHFFLEKHLNNLVKKYIK